MTSTNSDEIKSVSRTTDSELQIRNEQIQNFIYPNMPKSNPHLYDKNKTRIISTNLFQLEYNDIFHNILNYIQICNHCYHSNYLNIYFLQ